MEIEPEIGLRFVELADRIEDALGVRTEVVSRRAIKPRYWKTIQEELVDVVIKNRPHHDERTFVGIGNGP